MTTVVGVASLAASTDTSHAQRATSTQRLVTPAPTSQDVQQIRAISSELASTKAKVDKERSPDTPKKTDAGFGAQEDKEDFQFQNQYTKRSKDGKSEKRLEVVA